MPLPYLTHNNKDKTSLHYNKNNNFLQVGLQYWTPHNLNWLQLFLIQNQNNHIKKGAHYYQNRE